jgi:hypothetical protein
MVGNGSKWCCGVGCGWGGEHVGKWKEAAFVVLGAWEMKGYKRKLE